MRKALVTGITGQDGSFLAEWLLQRNYEVFGTTRRSIASHDSNLAAVADRIRLFVADLADGQSLESVVQEVRPHEVYNLAAQSFVPTSFRNPVASSDITAVGVVRLLEAVRRFVPRARFYQASSSEMFGRAVEMPQKETTPFHPRSPYGVAKVFGHHVTVNYRESYGLYAVSGILFNHESERRGLEFVTRKVTDAAARAFLGILDRPLMLGNIDSCRDWGYAPDYVRAMWLMLQQRHPQDFVIATGKAHSVRDLLRIAFRHVGLRAEDHVRSDAGLMRPAEVEHLVGDASRARKQLRWKPTVDFHRMIERMVEHDLRRLKVSERHGELPSSIDAVSVRPRPRPRSGRARAKAK